MAMTIASPKNPPLMGLLISCLIISVLTYYPRTRNYYVAVRENGVKLIIPGYGHLYNSSSKLMVIYKTFKIYIPELACYMGTVCHDTLNWSVEKNSPYNFNFYLIQPVREIHVHPDPMTRERVLSIYIKSMDFSIRRKNIFFSFFDEGYSVWFVVDTRNIRTENMYLFEENESVAFMCGTLSTKCQQGQWKEVQGDRQTVELSINTTNGSAPSKLTAYFLPHHHRELGRLDVYEFVAWNKDYIPRYPKDVYPASITDVYAYFDLPDYLIQRKIPEVYLFETFHKNGLDYHCDENIVCNGTFMWNMHKINDTPTSIYINVLRSKEVKELVVCLKGETIDESLVYYLKVEQNGKDPPFNTLPPSTLPSYSPSSYTPLSYSLPFSTPPPSTPPLSTLPLSTPPLSTSPLTTMEITAIGSGLMVGLLLFVLVIQLFWIRRLKKTRKVDDSIALRSMANSRQHGENEEFPENRESGVYHEPEDRESDYESLSDVDPTKNFKIPSPRLGDDIRYVGYDTISSGKRQVLPQAKEAHRYKYICITSTRPKSCDLTALQSLGASSRKEGVGLRRRPNSEPGYDKQRLNVDEAERLNTTAGHYDTLCVVAKGEDVEYENFALMAGGLTEKTTSTLINLGVIDLETTTCVLDNRSVKEEEEEPVQGSSGDGDYLTVLDTEEEPIIYLELDEF